MRPGLPGIDDECVFYIGAGPVAFTPSLLKKIHCRLTASFLARPFRKRSARRPYPLLPERIVLAMQSMIGKGSCGRTRCSDDRSSNHQKSEEQTMKKMIFTLGLAIATTAALGTAQAEEGLDLAKKSGCLACHSVDKKVV